MGPGVQLSTLGYPHLSRGEIFAAVETFYRRFYFRPRKIMAMGREMLRDRQVLRRRLGEGRDFLRFLARRRSAGPGRHRAIRGRESASLQFTVGASNSPTVVKA